MPESLKLGPAALNAFHADSFAIALGMHLLVSTARGAALWRDAAHVPAAADRPRGLDCARCLWSGLLHPILGLLNPVLDEPYRLVLVHRVAGGFRHRRGPRGRAAAARADARERVRSPSRGHRSARNDFTARGREATDEASVMLCAFAMLAAVLLSACGTPPGRPQPGSEVSRPERSRRNSTRLYADNCAGCHGAEGRGGAAIALANPVYLAIVDERVNAHSASPAACAGPRCRHSRRARAAC